MKTCSIEQRNLLALLLLAGLLMLCGFGKAQTEQCDQCECIIDDSAIDNIMPFGSSAKEITAGNPVLPLKGGYELEYTDYRREGSQEIIELSLLKGDRTLCIKEVNLVGNNCEPFCYCDKNSEIIISIDLYRIVYKGPKSGWPDLAALRVWQKSEE